MLQHMHGKGEDPASASAAAAHAVAAAAAAAAAGAAAGREGMSMLEGHHEQLAGTLLPSVTGGVGGVEGVRGAAPMHCHAMRHEHGTLAGLGQSAGMHAGLHGQKRAAEDASIGTPGRNMVRPKLES